MAEQLNLEPLLLQVIDSAGQLLKTNMSGLLVLGEGHASIHYFKISRRHVQFLEVPMKWLLPLIV
jgi:hypothetical protein